MLGGTLTKADLRRAIVRTAAAAHIRHDRTGCCSIPCAFQDNDAWESNARRDATITFARQAKSKQEIPSGRTEGSGAAGAFLERQSGAAPHIFHQHPAGPQHPAPGAPAGADAPQSRVRPGLSARLVTRAVQFVRSFHFREFIDA